MNSKLAAGTRFTFVAGVILVLCASAAWAAGKPGYKLVNTHKLSSVRSLGKAPTACTTYQETGCVQKGSYGSVSFSPHVLKPGEILTATVKPTSACANCHANWPATGKITDNVLEYLKPLKCGALSCTWRLAKDAPLEPYLVIEVDISPIPATGNGPSDVTSYVGVRSTWALKYVE